jgi:hypothetical protein
MNWREWYNCPGGTAQRGSSAFAASGWAQSQWPRGKLRSRLSRRSLPRGEKSSAQRIGAWRVAKNLQPKMPSSASCLPRPTRISWCWPRRSSIVARASPPSDHNSWLSPLSGPPFSDLLSHVSGGPLTPWRDQCLEKRQDAFKCTGPWQGTPGEDRAQSSLSL